MEYTPWLLRKSERESFSQCLTLSEGVLDHANHLEKAINYYLEEDFENCNLECNSFSEREIRKLGKRITFELVEKIVSVENRGDISRIIFGFEEISSFIGSTAFRLTMKGVALDSHLKEQMRNMITHVIQILSELDKTIKFLNVNLKAVQEKTNNISIIEENIDVIRRNMLKHLVNISITDHVKLFVVAEILNSLESIADSANMTANVIEIIVVRHLP